MKTKLALAMIVKPSDNEAIMLQRCLRYVHEHVDGIFITITGENERVLEIANSYNAVVSYYEWDYHFANARNFNFSQVPKEYTHILWLDSDDVLRGGEMLKEILEDNPKVDAFLLNYLYSFDRWRNPDVVHLKTQIVKNDGCVEWAGRLHEDFKANRKITTFMLEGIDRLHLTNEEKVGDARERNLIIARKQAEDEPKDPRSYWNLGNSLKAVGLNDESIEAFDRFLDMSKSDEEKYIVRLRRAEIYWQAGDKKKALDEARYAIGMRPEYPDAYHLAGHLCLELKRYEESRDLYQQGLTKKPPKLSIIVYNPRNYDYVPLMNLAKVYFNLSMPTLALVCLEACQKIYPENQDLSKLIETMQEEAKKFEQVTEILEKLGNTKSKKKMQQILDKVPVELKAHPALTNFRNLNFIKETSTGKDLVIFCGYTSQEWSPKTAKEKGVGGSEEAVIHLAKRWAEMGWNVTVYNNIGHMEQVFDNVVYKPFWEFNYRDKQDIIILWRNPALADYDINCDKIYVDLHDVVPEGEFNEKRLEKVTKIFVKTEFHRSLFPNIPDEKFVIVPNGIDPAPFLGENERDYDLLINTSSPDRSMSSLLDIYERVKKEVPEAKLTWAYGWSVWDDVHADDPSRMAWKEDMVERMKKLGVTNLGRINHEQVAKLYNKANAYLYPTEFAEIHCISMVKAQAGGALPITTDFGALNETVQYGTKVKSEKTKDNWCEAGQFDFGIKDERMIKELADETIRVLKEERKERDRYVMRAWAVNTYSWDDIARKWNEIFRQ